MSKAENTQATPATEAAAPRAMRLRPIIGNIMAGLKTAWPIFGDVHPAIALTEAQPGFDDRGRQGNVVTLLVQRSNLSGDPYTKVQKVLEQFVFQRPEGMEGALIDGVSVDEALDAHADRFGEYLDGQQKQASVYTE